MLILTSGFAILCVILLYMLFIYKAASEDYLDKEYRLFLLMSVSIFAAACCIIIMEVYSAELKPIDVYRDKTEFQIIYRGTEPIDSAVVWKQK